MKRVLAAAVAAAALVTASPAQAAVDPVKALKKQFVAGHGVTISEVSRTQQEGKKLEYLRMTGTFAFGESGVVASDITLRGALKPSSEAALRFLIIGKKVYAQSAGFKRELPEGKSWLLLDDASNASATTQPIDIFRSGKLKSLLSHAKSAKGGLYRGSFHGDRERQAFDYRLSVSSTGLPSRFHTSSKSDYGTLGWYRETTDSRYTAWGHKVTIEAPPEDQVIDIKDAEAALDEVLEEIQVIPNEALATR
ncbi:hypothetical protein [Nonomuraea helvata]|uniref:LppX_LprAFG lipoprotein n=1 Tax=Nonomuraea helvata TaxID=37484 RepID=A0ABV5RW85_9ACTN